MLNINKYPVQRAIFKDDDNDVSAPLVVGQYYTLTYVDLSTPIFRISGKGIPEYAYHIDVDNVDRFFHSFYPSSKHKVDFKALEDGLYAQTPL